MAGRLPASKTLVADADRTEAMRFALPPSR